MPMYAYDKLPTVENEFKTAKNEDSPLSTRRFRAQERRRKKKAAKAGDENVDEKVAVTRTGLGEGVKGTSHVFTTSIKWSAVNAVRDGTQVEATVLGPDHKLGEQPDKNVCPNADTLNRKIGKTAKTGYVKGHLLNHNLGGPGNDERNLVAIPRSTNLAMSTHVEEKLKKLVNQQRAWVYFKGSADHATWKGLTYASKLRFQWHQLHPDAGGAPEQVQNTAATVDFDIPRPDHYADVNYDQATNKRTKGRVETGVPDAAVDATTAVAGAAWNAMVLDTPKNLKMRVAILTTATAELAQLEADDAKALVDHLCSGETPEEAEALRWIETEVTAAQSEPRPLNPEFPTQLDTHETLRSARLDSALRDINGLLTVKAPLQATALLSKLTELLRENDPLATYRDAITLLLKQNQQLEEDNVDYRLAQMSPNSLDQVAGDFGRSSRDEEEEEEEDEGNQRLPSTSSPRCSVSSETYSNKRDWLSTAGKGKEVIKKQRVREKVKAQTPTNFVLGMVTKLQELRNSVPEVASGGTMDTLDWSGLDGLEDSDPDVHETVVSYLRGQVKDRALTMMLVGAEKVDPDRLMPYLRELSRRISSGEVVPGAAAPCLLLDMLPMSSSHSPTDGSPAQPSNGPP